MYKLFPKILFFILFLSCEKSQDEILESYDAVMSLKIENDNTYADNFSKLKVIAEFPNDFSTEDDNKVDFFISKEIEELKVEPIRLIQEDGIAKRIAETSIIHNKEESLNVKAVIKINGVETSKNITVSFKKAFFDDLKITSNSLFLTPNSFNNIQLTTELSRTNGVVSINSIAETLVKDGSGNTIGIFNNYKNKTDTSGKIINNFTLGNNNYTGILYAIISSDNENGETKKDTLIIYSN